MATASVASLINAASPSDLLTPRQRAASAVADAAADTIGRLHLQAGGDPVHEKLLAFAARQVWRADELGDVCIRLSALHEYLPRTSGTSSEFAVLAGTTASSRVASKAETIAATTVVDILRASPVVATPAPGESPARPLPLVMQAGLLYSYRHWLAEHTIATGLLALAARAPTAVQCADAAENRAPQFSAQELQELFASVPGTEQTQALAVASSRALLILSGGPGTGKTHTLGAIVRYRRAQDPALRIALAAPTGKAAARLNEALNTSFLPARSMADAHAQGGQAMAPANDTAKDTANRSAAPVAGTLHRLLGYLPGGQFRHDAENPLPYDLIIVDECSMVDAAMAAQLLAALAPHAQLILAGDMDQLSSVEAGAFFGALCAAQSDLLAACTVVLKTNFRQRDAAQILAWADAVRRGQVPMLGGSHDQQVSHATSNDLVAPPRVPGSAEQVQLHRLAEPAAFQTIVSAAVRAYQPLVTAAVQASTDDEARAALRAFDQVRVLAALRAGPFGVHSLNRAIIAQLRMHLQRLIEQGTQAGWPNAADMTGSAWFVGRLVIVTRNMPAMGLFNGDIGLAVSNRRGGVEIVIEGGGNPVRRLLPLQMPPCDDAFALTVHQSQGSAFDRVLLLPAPAQHPLASRSGLYTGMTRARLQLEIFGMPADLAWAAEHAHARDGGLQARLTV